MPIDCHPMKLLPLFASSNVADIFAKSLPTPTHHRHVSLIGDIPTASATSVTAVVASPAVVDTAVPASDSVPTLLHPNLALAPALPIALDTGASCSTSPSKSDFLPVAQAPCGLIRSSTLVTSKVNSVSVPSKSFQLIRMCET